MKHAKHYSNMFSKIMVSLGVVIPSFVDGMQLLRCFLTKKYTLEVIEEFVDSEVLEAVRQRIAMVKIERKAKVEELKEIAVTVEGERARMAERNREEKKEKARQRKEERKQRKKEQVEQARQRMKEQEERKQRMKEQVEQALQQMKEQEEHARQRMKQRKEEQVEQARQRMKEQEEHALQQKEEQGEQAPKTRGKYKTFDDRMEDLKLFKEKHGHVNVSIPEDNTLAQFCLKARHAHNNPGKGKKLTAERIAALDALGFIWTTQEYVTRSFDERIDDLEKYKQTHGHLSLKRLEDISLYQFCAGIRQSLLHDEKNGKRKLTVERIARLDAICFEWATPR